MKYRPLWHIGGMFFNVPRISFVNKTAFCSRDSLASLYPTRYFEKDYHSWNVLFFPLALSCTISPCFFSIRLKGWKFQRKKRDAGRTSSESKFQPMRGGVGKYSTNGKAGFVSIFCIARGVRFPCLTPLP